MSPDVFLSQHGIRTSDFAGFNGTAAQKVANLQALNKTRTWNPDTQQFDYTRYHTAGFTPTSYNASSSDSSLGIAQSNAVRNYLAIIKTGNLPFIYAAVDAINDIRQVVGGVEFVPFSDWDLIAEGPGDLGACARFINSERMAVAETGVGSFSGSPLPWFDTKDAFDALNAYAL